MPVEKAVDYTKVIDKTDKKQRKGRKKNGNELKMPMGNNTDQVDYIAVSSWWKEQRASTVNEAE